MVPPPHPRPWRRGGRGGKPWDLGGEADLAATTARRHPRASSLTATSSAEPKVQDQSGRGASPETAPENLAWAPRHGRRGLSASPGTATEHSCRRRREEPASSNIAFLHNQSSSAASALAPPRMTEPKNWIPSMQQRHKAGLFFWWWLFSSTPLLNCPKFASWCRLTGGVLRKWKTRQHQ